VAEGRRGFGRGLKSKSRRGPKPDQPAQPGSKQKSQRDREVAVARSIFLLASYIGFSLSGKGFTWLAGVERFPGLPPTRRECNRLVATVMGVSSDLWFAAL